MKRQKKYCSRKCYWSDPEQIQRARESKLGNKNPWFGTSGPMAGRKHTAERNEMMSRRFSGAGNPFYGKMHTEETKNISRRPGSKERKAIKHACHGFIWNAIGRIPTFKADEVIPESGWSAAQLRARLEPLLEEGMTWENHSRDGWHIDHIRPICSFPIGTPLSEINALENLRPLWAKDNLSKGGKWNETAHSPSKNSG